MTSHVKRVAVVYFCAFVIVFAGGICAPVFTQAAELKPYRIGAILPTTGRFGSFGQSELGTMRLVVDGVNNAGGVRGHKVELIHDDNETDAAKAASLARKQVTYDKVSAIFGTHPTEGSLRMSDFLEQQKIPMLAPNPLIDLIKNKPYVFLVMNTTDQEGEQLGRYVSQFFKWKRVVIVSDTIAYSISIAKSAEKYLKAAGVEVLKDQYSNDDVDLTPLWTRVEAQKPDGIYLVGGVPGTAYFMKARKLLNIQTPVLGSNGIIEQKFFELAGDAAEGVYCLDYFVRNEKDALPGEREFMRAYNAKYPGKIPQIFEGEGWDAAKIIVKGMETAGDDPVKLRNAIENIKGLQGALGEYNYSKDDHSGGLKKPLKVTVYKGGQFHLVYRLSGN